MEDDEILQEEITETDTQPEPQIYTGPNIAAFGLMRFHVYRGGLPLTVRKAVEKIPEIAELIVPVSGLEEMREKIAKAGTNEARLFYTVQTEAEKFNAIYRREVRGSIGRSRV